MARVCAVSFERYGRLYYFDPGPHLPRVGEKVLIPTDEGPEVAECVWAAEEVAGDVGGLPRLVGMASAEDLARDERSRRRRAEAKVAVKRLVRAHDLPMKVVGVDFVEHSSVLPDAGGQHSGGQHSGGHRAAARRTSGTERGGPRFTIYFSAPHRVDFRELVRDLGRTLQARVELRQIGARDEARVQGGIGPCGRDLCCATFLKDFEPVSVRMAKDQDLPLNPLKIAGACGRLMCCLKYEHPLYQEFHADAPAVGTAVTTPAGDGTVVGHNVPADTVLVRLAESGRRTACSKASVCGSRQAFESAHPPSAEPRQPD